jgi:hypothetical protein
MNTKLVRRYLHDDTEDFSHIWSHDSTQQEVYAYALYEVAIDLEVDMDTGKSRIVAVDGRELKEPGDFR